MIPLMPNCKCLKCVTYCQLYWVLGPHGWIHFGFITPGKIVKTLADTPDAKPQVHEKCHMFSGVLGTYLDPLGGYTLGG